MGKTFRTLPLAMLLLALAACGGGRGGHPYGIPAQFGDADPHAWHGNVPANYAVHGVDVSRFQGDVDWSSAAGAGISFAYIKATEGGDLADPQFAAHWYGTAQAGIPRGAYHFWFNCRSGAEQAAWFIQNVPRESGALPPVLDVEWTQSRRCPMRPEPATVRAEMNSFLTIVGQHYGRWPVIYTSVDYYEDNQLWQLQGYEFWLRSVAGHPNQVFSGQNWTFWQYTGTGLAPGFRGHVDLNTFAGSPEEWQAWLASHVM